jgi:8-amino-7-oxononanoate synthase
LSDSALIADLSRALDSRREEGLFRRRRTLDSAQGPRVRVEGRDVVAFASNDYLGLANDPAVVAGLVDGAVRFGAGAGASHLVCGHQRPHADLEEALASYVAPCASARAVAFATGYLANLAVVTALAGREDAVFGDRLNHASLNDAAMLSRADFVRYPHADVAALARMLDASSARRKLILTDAVFSMDGDVAPLPALLDLARRHDAWLVADDAHGFGVTGGGRGTLARFGIADERVVYVGTLGKAAGVAGAFVAAHPVVAETIVQAARPYVYTTAAPAALACALLAALARIRAADAERAHLAALIARFRQRAADLPWCLLASDTPIQPLIVGGPGDAVALADALWREGLWVPAIRPPTVPKGTARLRVSLSAAHTADDVDRLADALARAAVAR